jgi:hypothetical protein
VAPSKNLLSSLFVSMIVAAVGGSTACGPSNATDATYSVLFTLADTPEDLATLRFRVVYTGGELPGNGTAVSCELLEDGDGETADFEDDDDDTLEVDIDATDNPIAADTDIVTCDFFGATQPNAGNFTITVLHAEDEDGNDVQTGDVDVIVSSTDIADSAEAAE